MKLTGFGGYDWEADGYFCGIPANSLPFATVQHSIINRVGASAAFGSAIIPVRTLPVVFGYTGSAYSSFQNAFADLLRKLEPTNPTPRQLRAQRIDGTNVAISAVLNLPNTGFGGDAVNEIEAQFLLADPLWIALLQSGLGQQFASALDQALSLGVVAGNGETPIKLAVQPTVQRAAPTAAIGWKYRVIKRVTNNGDEPLVRFPIFIDMGNTTTPVGAGKAQADGDDLIVVIDGIQKPRTLRNWNAATLSGFWVIIEYLPAGGVQDIEVWYGNASATVPATLQTIPIGATVPVNLPPFDLATSVNETLNYHTDDVSGSDNLGIWGIYNGTPDFNRPLAWKPDATCPNRGNRDDFAQREITEYVATGTRHRATFDAERSRDGGRNPAGNRERDGVSFHHPLGITKINVGFSFLNERTAGTSSDPVGQLVIGSRPSGANNWAVVSSNVTVQATPLTIAAADYTPATAAKEMMCAIWPFDSVAVVRTAKKNKRAEGVFTTDLTVTIPTTNLSITTQQAETEVYELATSVTIHEDGRRRRYRKVQLGGGGSSRRLAVPLGNQLVIRPDVRRIEEWNSGLTAMVQVVPPTAYAVLQGIVDASGVASEIASDAWPAVNPYSNPLPNPSFTTNLTGWVQVDVTVGMTVAWTRDVGTFFSAPSSVDAVISANTAGANAFSTFATTDYFPIGGRRWVSLAAQVRVSNANLTPRLMIFFYDALLNFISATTEGLWTPVINTWYRRVLTSVVPANATQVRYGMQAWATGAGATGFVLFDDMAPNSPEVVLTDDALGTIFLASYWFQGYP